MNKVASEDIRELLARYMEGDSSQEELRLLKEFFNSADSLPDDLAPYAQMFAILDEKPQTPTVEALDRLSEGPVPAPRRRIPLWPLLAAACIAAFAFIFLTPPKQQDNMAIAYVDGKMLEGEAVAMQMGQEALQEIFSNGNEEEQLTDLFNAQ